ncbi:MAG: respiratory nitrate reductase subunit gamma [Deltaproteobacteria bacterium]|nr:respiratory nitrate reductase subunit gamma [Deltaproteobacteria bacterium]
MTLLQLLTYVSLVIFGIGIARTAIKYVKMPIHLRWELYPVAHEKGRDYGGSYFENLDWWTKPRKKSLLGEIKFMIPEILLIRTLFHHNRKLWNASFPFHGGLYLLMGLLGLILIGAVVQAFGVAVSPESSSRLVTLLYYVTVLIGFAGLTSALWGCARLLFTRFTDEDLKICSTPLDYINLFFILAVLLSALNAWLFVDNGFIMAREYIQSLITLKSFSTTSLAVKVEIILLALFMIYFPFTHMTHMFTKYFTYHKVRWEDEPNIRGEEIEARVKAVLQRNVSWAAPHIPTGKKWSEIAKENNE